jgi:hypothetical protein
MDCFHFTYRDQYADINAGNSRLESGLIYSSVLLTATAVSAGFASVSYEFSAGVLVTIVYGVPLEVTIIYQLCGIFAVSSFSFFPYDKKNKSSIYFRAFFPL